MSIALVTPVTAEELSDPGHFELGYAMSFPTFDACGDSEIGRSIRRAILERFAQCPFSAEARERFQTWRIAMLEDIADSLYKLHAAGIGPIGPPEMYDWSVSPPRPVMTCSEYRQTPSYLAQRAKIERYAKGEISAAEAIGEDCPSGPAAL